MASKRYTANCSWVANTTLEKRTGEQTIKTLSNTMPRRNFIEMTSELVFLLKCIDCEFFLFRKCNGCIERGQHKRM